MMTMVQAAPGGQTAGTTGLLIGIAPWLLIFVIFYVLMIRPQQRRVKEHQAAIAAVKKGDEVITGGGIRGRVTKVSGDEAEVEIANGVRVRVVKSTLTGVIRQSKAGQRLMLEFPRWKVWLIGLVIAAGVLFSIPSLIAGTPLASSWPKWLPQYRISLGLDLAGGSHLLLEADWPTLRSSASRRWRIRSRPSFVATRKSTSATFRPQEDACHSLCVIRRRSTRRSNGCVR